MSLSLSLSPSEKEQPRIHYVFIYDKRREDWQLVKDVIKRGYADCS